MNSNHLFSIAGHVVGICFSPSGINDISLLPSFAPFRWTSAETVKPLLTLCVDDTLQPEKERKLLRYRQRQHPGLPTTRQRLSVHHTRHQRPGLQPAHSQCRLLGMQMRPERRRDDAPVRAEQRADAMLCFRRHPLPDVACSCLMHSLQRLRLSIYCQKRNRKEHPFLTMAPAHRGHGTDERRQSRHPHH